MINMIQKAKDQVQHLTMAAYGAAAAAGALPAGVEVKANVEIPKDVSNGDYTIEMQIEGLTEEPVEVEIDKEDDAQDVVQKVTQEVAAGAASEVVDQSGLTGEAADMADQLAQEAIRQGLSALPGGFNF